MDKENRESTKSVESEVEYKPKPKPRRNVKEFSIKNLVDLFNLSVQGINSDFLNTNENVILQNPEDHPTNFEHKLDLMAAHFAKNVIAETPLTVKVPRDEFWSLF